MNNKEKVIISSFVCNPNPHLAQLKFKFLKMEFKNTPY